MNDEISVKLQAIADGMERAPDEGRWTRAEYE